MLKHVKQKKYYAPQNEDKSRKCDFPGCSKLGEYRAPKNRNLKDYYWFCLEHVQAYNAKWNYYDGEYYYEDFQKKTKERFHFQNFYSHIKYQFGDYLKDDLGFFGNYGGDMPSQEDIFFTAKERQYLKIMELSAENISIIQIKKQYKKLVKKYHPDLHQENKKEAEENFKQLTTAYQALLKRFS